MNTNKLKMGLMGLVGLAAVLSCGRGEDIFPVEKIANQTITGLGTFTDRDYDGSPDVLYMPAFTPGSKNTYLYKEGYGPERAVDGEVEIVTKEKMEELYKKHQDGSKQKV